MLTPLEVNETIQLLDANKAVGPDLIHNKLLLASADYISEPLSIIFNKCLYESRFPCSWKTAHVTPIHKKGPKNTCNNYRPISLLSCVGKLFEKCVQKHIFNYLRENDILTHSQSGFIPGDSTINQLLSIYNDLCSAMDIKRTTQAVYLDISKAFDRVWHKGLLAKLEGIGIRGPLLGWFRDYLSNRKQATVIKGEKSDFLTITAGVPQGSVLGPLLFLIFINDVVTDITSTIKLFADDTSLSFALDNADLRAEILNQDLETITTWAQTWKVNFNKGKTDVLNFTRSHDHPHRLTFSNTTLYETTQHKHLGLTLQNNCKWDEHIKQLATKVTTLISCLRSFKYRISRKALKTLYQSFILPHFDYADIIWDNCTDTLANTLEELHLDAIRTITGSVRGTSHQKLYSESGFCSLKERRRRHKLVAFKKITLGLCPNYLSEMLPVFVSETNPYPRRRPLERKVPTFNTELYHDSFFPSTTELWNSLPIELQECNSLSYFKQHLCSQDTLVPPYYSIGDREEQIILCRMRIGMSNLNHDMVNRHLQTNPSCSCGHPNETAEHFLLYCQNYTNTRQATISNLLPDRANITTLLFGDWNLQLQDNIEIVLCVHNFIKQTKRF